MKTRILIVDDEKLARDRLRQLLEKEPDVELLGECAAGADAVAKIQRDRPDLVFLDVQMPGLDGFGVLEKIPRQNWPAVIFVTAHDKFALRAFEVHALDYLLKPFDRERFQRALRRAIQHLAGKQEDEVNKRLEALLAKWPGAKPSNRLAVKTEGRVLLLKLDDIDWAEAADNYVSLHVGNESHLLRETMASLETRLPARQFMRISRSAIVNLERIKELQPMFHGDYVVILKNGARVTLSRGYREKLNQLLGK